MNVRELIYELLNYSLDDEVYIIVKKDDKVYYDIKDVRSTENGVVDLMVEREGEL